MNDINMPYKKGYKQSENQKRACLESNINRRVENVERDKFGRILGIEECPICGYERKVPRARLGKHPLCISCSKKEQHRKYAEIYGHGIHWGGSKYFSGRLLHQWHFANRKIRSRRKIFLEWDLTNDYLDELYEKQNGRCALSGVLLSFDTGNINKVSLDRINSNLGYVKGNVQFVACIVNRMKQDYTDDMFIGMCNKIAKKHPR